LFAALHGELMWHPWRNLLVASSDPYSLFVARSSALGLLADARPNAFGGIWAMNDAGPQPGEESPTRPRGVAWFHVTLPRPIPSGDPLPVQAFLSCASHVVNRMGTLRLRSVQLLLPVQDLDTTTGALSRMAAVAALVVQSGWFTDGDPRAPVQVCVTVDGGQDRTVHTAALEMAQWLRTVNQSAFTLDSVSVADDRKTAPQSPVIDELWLGPPQYRAVFHGTLVEWSLDALGWLAAFLAEAGSLHGASNPVLLTASRTDEDH
jgi:hypothetical protein